MKLEEELKALYEPSEGQSRKIFLMQFDFPKMSYAQFVMGQVSFIRKRVWCLSAVFVMLTIVGLSIYGAHQCWEGIWIFSSILPFFLLASLTEVLRSVTYSMDELEQSCLYNLENVILARLGILGSFNVLLVIVLSFILRGDIGILQVGIYLSVPSLVSCLLSIVVVSYMHTREVVYVCAGVSVGVSLLNIMVSHTYQQIFMAHYVGYAVILAISLMVGIVFAGKKLWKRMERLEWNLLSMV